MWLPLRKVAAADLEPSAFVGTDPEERQGRRLDQRRASTGVAKPSEAQADHVRSRDADLLHGITHNQLGRDNVLWLASG